MSKITQREAVYVATMNVLADAGIGFDDGQAGGVSGLVTKDMRKSIQEVVVMGLMNGGVELSEEAKAKYDSADKMRSYVSGLVNNWFRKDKRLNGNTVYVTQNPGSRVGAGDEQLKALKTLRKAKEGDADAVAAIDQAIADRQAEIKAVKPSVTLTAEQLAAIPEELRAKLGL